MGLTLAAIYLVQTPEEEIIVESLPTQASERDGNLQSTKSAKPAKVAEEDEALLPDLSKKHLFVEDKSKKSQDLFKGHAWYIPPPPPKPVLVKVEPPAPITPPVPFVYLGKLENSPQGTQVFLSLNNKVLWVWVGKNVDPLWRLDKEDANNLTFTYLPLGSIKSLSKALRQPASNKTMNESNQDETS